MDDFFVYGSSFESCLVNIEKVLHGCKEVNLKLKWEKCHLMVIKGVFLVQVVSERGIKVDNAKVEVIERLPDRGSVS